MHLLKDKVKIKTETKQKQGNKYKKKKKILSTNNLMMIQVYYVKGQLCRLFYFISFIFYTNLVFYFIQIL